ncbi:MAG: MATE family efflux transporter [Schleiferiaceae bacterium]
MNKREHYKKNFALAYPVMLGSLGHIMVGVADSAMVGQLGALPLAAVSLSNSLFVVPLVFSMGVAFGMTPMVANADGEGNIKKSARYLKNGLVVNMISSILMFGAIYVLSLFISEMGQDPEVVDLSLPYLQVISLSIIPLMFFLTYKQFAEGLSDTKAAMRVSIAANFLNVGLNYVLIFGVWGFPEMGLMGAGYSTLISRILMAIAMYFYFSGKKHFRPYRELFGEVKILWKSAVELLTIGVPTALQYIFEVSAFAFAAIMIGWISPLDLAAHQIAISLASISYMLASGMSAAASIRVGNQLGQKDYKTLREATQTLTHMVIVFMAITGVIFLVGRHALPALYTDDAQVLAIAANLLIITTFFQLSDGVQVVALGGLRGLSDVKAPTYITFACYWLLAVPLAALLGFYFEMGVVGIWVGLAAGLTFAAIFLYLRMNQKTKSLLVD